MYKHMVCYYPLFRDDNKAQRNGDFFFSRVTMK